MIRVANKRSLLILFALISLLQCARGNVSQDSTHLVLYVSSSQGNDRNDGHTEKTPLRTIKKALRLRNNHLHLLLKCEDVFFESISGISDCIVESYGHGEKPVLCGFKILKNAIAWEKDTLPGVWRLDMACENNFAGFSMKDASDKACFNNIGCLYDSENDRLYGRLVKSKKSMSKEGDFYTSSAYTRNKVSFRYLYFKFDKNPECLGNLCFSTYNHGIYNIKRCIIRNIAIVGFARHGMNSINHSEILNCRIDIIGGSILIGYKYWVRYGNGIQCWIANVPVGYNTIKDCTISRTYDCGSTIQGKGSNMSNPVKIRFINNKFIFCRQAFEHWLSPADGRNLDYADCEFSHNICFMMGDNQFDTPLPQDANLLSYDKENRGLNICENLFYGASYYCGQAFATRISGNKVYVYRGQYLNHYHGAKNYPTIYATSKKDIEAYKNRVKDRSEIHLLDRDSKIDRKMKQKLLERIDYRPVRLVINKYIQ